MWIGDATIEYTVRVQGTGARLYAIVSVERKQGYHDRCFACQRGFFEQCDGVQGIGGVDRFKQDVHDAIAAQLNAKLQVVFVGSVVGNELVLLLCNGQQRFPQGVAFRGSRR